MFELWIDLYTGAQVSVLIKIDITDYGDESVVCKKLINMTLNIHILLAEV